jgi:very-short-patch-repair endonuclease
MEPKPQKTIQRVRQLRQRQTESEQKAWEILRNRRVGGFKFRRQFPIGNCVVDFCCQPLGLVVELEGSVHSQPSQIRKDQVRTRALRAQGYTVLVYPNGIVEQAPELFQQRVLEECLKAAADHPHPRPPRPPAGEGRGTQGGGEIK